MAMDVKKNKEIKKNYLTKHWLSIAIFTFVVISTLGYLFKNSSYKVSVAKVLVSEVQRGELNITVDGFGVLEPEDYLTITSRTSATVKEIFLRPGARVTTDSALVRLENLELEQELFTAQQALEMAEADLGQLSASQARELLLERSQMEELHALYETAKLKRIAQQKLVKNGIISTFEFTSSKLQEQQLLKRLELIKKRIDQLQNVHRLSSKAEQKRVELAKARLDVVKRNVDQLVIRAGMNGVLQRLPIALGQSLLSGQEIALIGSVDSLKALIRVSQSQAQRVEIGQVAEIRIQRDKVSGTVVRIDPIVEDNTVTVEVDLDSSLPPSARPQLNIDGKIVIEKLADTYFIDRPVNAKEGDSISLFKLETQGNTAIREHIKLGKIAGNSIQIASKTEEGTKYIISGLPNTAFNEDTLLLH